MAEFGGSGDNSKSEIQRIVSDLKGANVSFENHKKYYDKIKNTDSIIVSQVQNLESDYTEYVGKFNKASEKDHFKSKYESGVMDVDVFEDFQRRNKILQDAFTWKVLQQEMYEVILDKIYELLVDAKALEIKRDALAESRKENEANREMMVNITNQIVGMSENVISNKLQFFDAKMTSFNEAFTRDFMRQQNNTLNLVKLLLERSGVDLETQKKVEANFEAKPIVVHEQKEEVSQEAAVPKQPIPPPKVSEKNVEVEDNSQNSDIEGSYDDDVEDEKNEELLVDKNGKWVASESGEYIKKNSEEARIYLEKQSKKGGFGQQ